MTISNEMRTFLEKVDSIQQKFMESLITGQRDPIFGEQQHSATLNPRMQSEANITKREGSLTNNET